MMYGEMNPDMMAIMVDDFIADGSGEYDDLCVDYKSARYDSELETWIMDASDTKYDYMLLSDNDGNISIHTIGAK